MSTFPYFIVYDRANNLAITQLGAARDLSLESTNYRWVIALIGIAIVFFVVLVYLIYR